MAGLNLSPMATSALGNAVASAPGLALQQQQEQAKTSVMNNQATTSNMQVGGEQAYNKLMAQQMQNYQPGDDQLANIDNQTKAMQQTIPQLAGLGFGEKAQALQGDIQKLQQQKIQMALSKAAIASRSGNYDALVGLAPHMGIQGAAKAEYDPDAKAVNILDKDGNVIGGMSKETLDSLDLTPEQRANMEWHKFNAQMMAGSREKVAETNAGAKLGVEELRDKQAKDAIGKVGQDVRNGWTTPENAADRIKFLDSFRPTNTGGGAGGQVEKLSPDALKILAQEFHMYGDSAFAHLGNRLAASAIPAARNMEADMYGTAARNYVAGGAGLKADTTSLAKLTQQRDAVSAFEKTALANGQKALDIATRVVDVGSPLFNKPIRDWEKGTLGDRDIATLHAAMDVFAKEVARVTSNPNLTGQLTDNQIKEIKAINSDNATLGQMKDVYNLYKFDMAQRHSNLDHTIDEVKGRIKPIETNPTGGKAISLEDYLKQ
jgi:hypothetical protein